MRSALLRAVGIMVALAALLVAGGLLWLRASRPVLDGERTAAGLRAEVEIWRDSLGVPHIWASSLEDLLFAQGWVHAQERLWQMELLRRVAQGRLAEGLGEDLLPSDRFLRTLGLWRAAAESERRLDDRMRALLSAYVAGVNAGIAAHRVRPPELVVLRIHPEPWTLRHALAIEKIMGFDLSSYAYSAAASRAAVRVGAERVVHLMPPYPDWGVTILEDEPRTAPIPDTSPLAPREALAQVAAPPAGAARLLDRFSIVRGSNAWVIGGSRTASGKPIVANDMHLSLGAPGVWILNALHAPGLDVVGMSLPGAPLVVAGHNRAVAWGFTNAYVDDSDFFVERVDAADTTRYVTPAGSLPFEVAQETLRVKGSDDVELLRVRRTRHGPVVSDVARDLATGPPVAFRWVSHDSTATFRAILGMNSARTVAELDAALADFDAPHQNVVMADTAGGFGYRMAGRVPVRGTGRPPPITPVPGWTGEWDWTGELPFHLHPAVLAPERGYVVTANNRQQRGPAGERIATWWEEPFRAQRIRELVIAAAEPLDAAAVHRQQLDLGDAAAERYRERAAAAAAGAGLDENARELRAWDLRAASDSRAASLYYVWFERLRQGYARALYGEAGGWVPAEAVHTALERDGLPWLAAGGAAALRAAAITAAREADSIVGDRVWGELHRLGLRHDLGDVPVIGALLDLNIGGVAGHGSHTTVNVAHYGGPDFPVRTAAGVSQRHVVDMADVDGSGGFILPAGVSGSPFSRHYRDHFARWREGGLWLVPLDRARAEARAVHRLTLKPER